MEGAGYIPAPLPLTNRRGFQREEPEPRACHRFGRGLCGTLGLPLPLRAQCLQGGGITRVEEEGDVS